MKHLFAFALLLATTNLFAQRDSDTPIFGENWTSPYSTTFSQGSPMESSFPSGFKITRAKDKIYRSSYVFRPGTTDTFSTTTDTLDLKKKVIAYSKAGRKIESTVSVSKDGRQVQIKRNFFYADDPKKLEFSVDEIVELLDNGDAVIRKTSKATDPDSQWNFVGEKIYPKDGQATQNPAK